MKTFIYKLRLLQLILGLTLPLFSLQGWAQTAKVSGEQASVDANASSVSHQWFYERALDGHMVKILPVGEELFQQRIDRILKAKKSVYLSTFIYDTDISARQIGWALCEKAKQGLDVRMILDGFGGKKFYKDYADSLRECGVAIMLFNPTRWGVHKAHYVIHEKLLVVDGETVMMGGNGIGDPYHKHPGAKKYFQDIDMVVEGPSACVYQQIFAKYWNLNLKKALDFPSREEQEVGTWSTRYWSLFNGEADDKCDKVAKGQSKVLPLYNNPYYEKKKRPIYEHYKLAIGAATKTIDLNAPYFVPHKGFIEDLVEARKRGVRVRVMTNSIESNDEGFVTLLGMMMTTKKLREAGVEFLLYKGPRTFHRKGGMFDNKIVYIGSDNLDNRGHQFQSESIAFTDDAGAVADFTKEFEADVAHSVSLDPAYQARIWKGAPWWKKWIIRRIIKQL